MKTHEPTRLNGNPAMTLRLIALTLFATLASQAQSNTNTFTTGLYSFTGGSDGANPPAGLILSGSTLYGTTYYGGSNSEGVVFAVNTNGTGFTVLHAFSALTGNATNSDGANPTCSLVLSSNTLYGTTQTGGAGASGSVFAVNVNGTGFATVYAFSGGNDGAGPPAGLILSSNTLYGTTLQGGTNGGGTVFAVNTDGTGHTVLHAFIPASDGNNLLGSLVLSGTTLYGTAAYGGTNSSGTVFAVNTDGTGFAVLYTFSASIIGNSGNSDGAYPFAGLALSGTTLYGTTADGGTNNYGTVFTLNTDGTGFAVLHTFSALTSNHTNYDGANPEAGLILSGSTLYGTAELGGNYGRGVVFSVGPPPPPPLGAISAGNQTVLFYQPVAGINYTLQTTTNPASGNWVRVTNSTPFVALGVANPAPAAFFRLSGLSLPPPLMAALLGNQVVVLYPESGTADTLLTAANLASGPWVPVTGSVPFTGVTVTNSSPPAYFRLQ